MLTSPRRHKRGNALQSQQSHALSWYRKLPARCWHTAPSLTSGGSRYCPPQVYWCRETIWRYFVACLLNGVLGKWLPVAHGDIHRRLLPLPPQRLGQRLRLLLRDAPQRRPAADRLVPAATVASCRRPLSIELYLPTVTSQTTSRPTQSSLFTRPTSAARSAVQVVGGQRHHQESRQHVCVRQTTSQLPMQSLARHSDVQAARSARPPLTAQHRDRNQHDSHHIPLTLTKHGSPRL